MKSISEMTDAEVDYEIADMRGWVQDAPSHLDRCGVPVYRPLPLPTRDPEAAYELRAWFLDTYFPYAIWTQPRSHDGQYRVKVVGWNTNGVAGSTLLAAEARAILEAIRVKTALT